MKITRVISAITLIFVLCSVCVMAKSGTEQKELWFNNISINLNGSELVPKDGNGVVVEPFAIEGTTYLPIRAIAEALGLKVDWDSENNTVKLSSVSKVKAECSINHFEGDSEFFVDLTDSEPQVNICFTAEGNVTDFKIVKLEYVVGNSYNVTEVLYSKDSLASGERMVAGLTFPGYLPGYGIVYTDDSGKIRHCAVSDGGSGGYDGINVVSLMEIEPAVSTAYEMDLGYEIPAVYKTFEIIGARSHGTINDYGILEEVYVDGDCKFVVNDEVIGEACVYKSDKDMKFLEYQEYFWVTNRGIKPDYYMSQYAENTNNTVELSTGIYYADFTFGGDSTMVKIVVK